MDWGKARSEDTSLWTGEGGRPLINWGSSRTPNLLG